MLLYFELYHGLEQNDYLGDPQIIVWALDIYCIHELFISKVTRDTDLNH